MVKIAPILVGLALGGVALHPDARAAVNFGGTRVRGALPSLFATAEGADRPLLAMLASAFDEGAPPPRCSDDRPRDAAGGRAIGDYNTAEFLPGLDNVAWGAVVHDQLVVLAGVAVVRAGSAAVSAPTVEIYTNWRRVADKREAVAEYALGTAVTTYRARQGFLYRVFVTDKRAPVSCIDLLIPYSGFAARAGRIEYRIGGAAYAAPFRPALLR